MSTVRLIAAGARRDRHEPPVGQATGRGRRRGRGAGTRSAAWRRRRSAHSGAGLPARRRPSRSARRRSRPAPAPASARAGVRHQPRARQHGRAGMPELARQRQRQRQPAAPPARQREAGGLARSRLPASMFSVTQPTSAAASARAIASRGEPPPISLRLRAGSSGDDRDARRAAPRPRSAPSARQSTPLDTRTEGTYSIGSTAARSANSCGTSLAA